MLSDEEKKAIETIKDFKNLKWYEHAFDNGTEVLDEEQKQDIEIILNLIEKQSKEIEESEQKEKQAYIDGTNVAHELCNKMWKNKIKAKIEEFENKIKKIRSKKLINEPEDTIVITRYAHYISVLQSLLEKE